jgi:hypothetical protein
MEKEIRKNKLKKNGERERKEGRRAERRKEIIERSKHEIIKRGMEYYNKKRK